MSKERILVFSAHTLDYLWRCGGTLVQYIKNGADVKVVVLSYGEHGESNDVWKKNPGITAEEVKKIRRKDSDVAAEIMGITDIEYLDWGDHPMDIDTDRMMILARYIMEFQPTIIINHLSGHKLNRDHGLTADSVIAALRLAQVSGTYPELKSVGWVKMFMFEPAHPEFNGFNPDTYIDITDVWDIKEKAMRAAAGASQTQLINCYIERANYRGYLARRVSCNPAVKQAEAYMRFNQFVGKEFN